MPDLNTIDLPSQIEQLEQLDDGVCHIDDGSGERAYCNAPSGTGPVTCAGEWDGETVCASCGCPVCQRCVVLSDLDDLTEDAAVTIWLESHFAG